MRSTRGFTLIELMVAGAVVAVLVALAVAAFSRIGGQAAPQNAAHDLYSALQRARSIAVGRNAQVWVVVYPLIGETAAAGNGAWFVLEDREGNFGIAGSPGATYAAFDPLSPHPANAGVRLIEHRYLDRYPRRNARFGTATGSAGASFRVPFEGLNALAEAARTCSFCSGNGPAQRGAIVFDGNGSARFVDATGAPAAPASTATQTANRTHTLALSDGDGTERGYLYAISAPTGFIGFHQ